MFLKASAMESAFFSKWRKGVRCIVKKIPLAHLLRSHYLFDILQTSLTVKSSENVVKSWCFEKRLWRRAPTSFGNEGGI